MAFIRTLPTVVLALACAQVSHAVYFLRDSYKGHDFFDRWTWQTFDDPTHGRVNYVDKYTAKSANLSTATFNKFFMRADSTSVVPPNARGRDSVRIHSNAAYGDSVIVLDVQHMPVGCGTWPAFWTNSQKGPWPQGGEIDIIEGVHLNTDNSAALHTAPGCRMPPIRFQTGKTVSTDCNVQVNFNQGCVTSFTKENSYGAGLNQVGGGWYVLERSRYKGIKVWFWPRNDYSVPFEVKHGMRVVVPDLWSECEPDAYFPVGDHCDYGYHFDEHEIIFDLTFCGDWAGNVWGTSGCGPGTCKHFVDNNPEYFNEAYWEINSLRVYTRAEFGFGVGEDDE